jgi:hypothetical protein
MFVALRDYLTQELQVFLKAVLQAVRDKRLVVKNWDGKVLSIPSDLDIFVSTPEAWTPEKAPAVLIEVPSVNLDFTSISKGFVRSDEDNRNYFAYEGTSTVELSCFGRSVPERNTLVDLVAFFLMRKDTFDYFMRRGIRFSEAVRVSGMGEETVPGQDFKLYFGTLSVGLNTETQIIEETEYLTIEKIIIEYTGEPGKGELAEG